jgi:hypothetical protein
LQESVARRERLGALGENFVECNGQLLDDAESPLDGQLMPDINTGGRSGSFAAA